MSTNLIRATVTVATAAAVLLGTTGLAWAEDNDPGSGSVTKEDLETLGWSCQYSGVNTEECTKGPGDGKYICNMNVDSCTWVRLQVTGGLKYIHRPGKLSARQ